MNSREPTREEIWAYVCEWVGDEYDYAVSKITQDPVTDDKKTKEQPDYWEDQILMYVRRAIVLGLDTPAGRQAAAKAATTAMCFFESVVRAYGVVPAPGVPSGENLNFPRRF